MDKLNYEVNVGGKSAKEVAQKYFQNEDLLKKYLSSPINFTTENNIPTVFITFCAYI